MKKPAGFCRACYADLSGASGEVCPRCGRHFDQDDSRTFLGRPFPSRSKIIGHSILNVLAATLVSAVVAGMLAAAQIKYIHSGH